MKTDIEKSVISIVKKLVGNKFKSEITSETNLVDDLSFDSITTIRLIIELDKYFNISIAGVSDEIDLSDIKTISDIVDLVMSLV